MTSKINKNSPVFYGKYLGSYFKDVNQRSSNGATYSVQKEVPQLSLSSRSRNYVVDAEPMTVGLLRSLKPGQVVSFQLNFRQYGGSLRPVPVNLSVAASDKFCEINDVDVIASYDCVLGDLSSGSSAHQVFFTTASGQQISIRTTLPGSYPINLAFFEACAYELSLTRNNGNVEAYVRGLRHPGSPKPVYDDEKVADSDDENVSDFDSVKDDLPFSE